MKSQVSAAVSTWSALTTTAPHAIITMLGTIRFVLVNIFISCELIYVTDDYNACPFLLINPGAKTVFAAIANSSANFPPSCSMVLCENTELGTIY